MNSKTLSPAVLLCAALILLAAAVPRFYGLGEPSFYGDEETTAFAVSSLVVEGEAKLPSGMPYRRATTFTWLSAALAQTLGLDLKAEGTYRLVPAFFGLLTVLLLFELLRRTVSLPVAVIACLILALSEWHIGMSRYARMYSPMLFFALLALYFFILGAMRDKVGWVVSGFVAVVLAAEQHILGALVAVAALIAVYIYQARDLLLWVVVAFSGVLVGLILAYQELYTLVPYREWRDAVAGVANAEPGLTWLNTGIYVRVATALAAAGLAWRVAIEPLSERWTHLHTPRLIMVLAASALGFGATYAGVLLLVIALLASRNTAWDFFSANLRIILSIGALAVVALAIGSFVGDWKRLLYTPFPYPVTLLQLNPGLFIAFCLAVGWLLLKPSSDEARSIKVLVITIFALLFGMGLVSEWGRPRYLLVTHPLIAATVGYAIVDLVIRIGVRLHWPSLTLIWIGGLVSISGVLAHSGVPQALTAMNKPYGLVSSANMFLTYPDHKSVGEYVAAQRSPGDLVVALDPYVQRWYAGTIDFGFANPERRGESSYRDKANKLRDIYVSARIADAQELLRLFDATEGRVWLITSGEIYGAERYQLSQEQMALLADLENSLTLRFKGRDGLSAVYCKGC